MQPQVVTPNSILNAFSSLLPDAQFDLAVHPGLYGRWLNVRISFLFASFRFRCSSYLSVVDICWWRAWLNIFDAQQNSECVLFSPNRK